MISRSEMQWFGLSDNLPSAFMYFISLVLFCIAAVILRMNEAGRNWRRKIRNLQLPRHTYLTTRSLHLQFVCASFASHRTRHSRPLRRISARRLCPLLVFLFPVSVFALPLVCPKNSVSIPSAVEKFCVFGACAIVLPCGKCSSVRTCIVICSCLHAVCVCV